MCMMSIDAFPGIILPLPESIRNLSRNRGGEDGRKLKKLCGGIFSAAQREF